MNKPELQKRMQAYLGLSDNDFAYYETDLYVLDKPSVMNWLKENYQYYKNVIPFVGSPESNWAGLRALEIPFEGMQKKPTMFADMKGVSTQI